MFANFAHFAALFAQTTPTQPPPQQPVPSQPAPSDAAQADPDDDAAEQNAQQEPQAPLPAAATIRSGEQPSSLEELIRSLDPSAVAALKGQEIKIERVGDQIFLHGPEDAVKYLELLIRGLDKEKQKMDVRVVTVSEKDAKDIARTVQEALRPVTDRPNQRTEERLTITALSANILLVSALPQDIDWVVGIIEQVDAAPDPLGPMELMSFSVKFRRASEVAKEVEKVFMTLQKAAGVQQDKSKLIFIPNDANNTITVTAREQERAKIQALIDQVDVEPVKGFGEVKLTVFPLLHSKPKEMADMIKSLVTASQQGATTGQGGSAQSAAQEVIYRLSISRVSPTGEISELPPIDLQRTLRIIPDEGTNSLIVATIEANVVPVGELVRMLDGVPMAEEVAVRLFPLKFADSDAVKEMLQGMFDKGKDLAQDPDGSNEHGVPAGASGKALVYGVGLASDARTNTVIVTGRAEQLTLAETVIAEIDRPMTSLRFPVRIFPLENTDATRVGQLLMKLFEQRVEAAQATGADKIALERERVFLKTDIRSNSLLVSASDENYAEIVKIARQLDAKPSKIHEQIRVVTCQRLAANLLKEKIDELWARKAALRSADEALEDKPVLAVDERSNTLIVAASAEDHEEISRLVQVLESQPRLDDTRLFRLEFADANVLGAMLDQLFEGMSGQSESFQAPTIMPDPRSNALVVAATRDTMDRVEDLVERLDVEAGPNTAVFKVYPLTFGSASKLAPRMQELFDSREEGQDTPRTPIVVLPDEASNSLVCSASRDDHDVIYELLGLLDKPSSIARQFQIFPMKFAKAANVAEKLDSLFASQAGGSSSAGRADAIASQADERTNSIIVWASPSEMENIKEVIARLDTATPVVEMMIKVIQLKQALAEDFSTLLKNTMMGESSGDSAEQAVIVSFLDRKPDGTHSIRKLLRQDIRIEPDTRTNSLMVMAPADSMTMLEAMIKDFDTIRPVKSEVRLFPLINSDAQTMVDQLNELFSTESSGADGQTRSQLVLGDAAGELEAAVVGQELRFAADPRTNTLIAAGAEIDLRMVEDLVRWLDSQDAEDRVSEVYNVRYLDGNELATAVRGFVEQEQQVLGDSDDQTSRLRRQERQVSVESVGSEESGSSSLIVGTSRRSYQRTMEMIQQLDRPEPQVMISVLIAEVTLSDGVELGVEVAGQDLNFSDSAILGPNGVIQGSDFDWVSGTELGAAGVGLGGLNFTVNGEDFSFLLHALQQDSRLEVLSRPILMVRNGQEGRITIADQFPFVESSQLNDTGSTNSTIGREDVGLVLTATPHISPDGYVTIALVQELSNVAGENVQLTEGVNSPVFQTREVDTNVTVRDGETVVIGGLITSRESEAENKVPIVGDIPLLGALFRFNNVRRQKTELLVVLTVDILRTDEDVYNMSVEQRDKFVLPDSIRQSPLMEGLRIRPEQQKAMGPEGEKSNAPSRQESDHGPRPDRRDQYGPKPKSYGPVITRPTSTTTAEIPVDESRVVRTDAGTPN